MILTEIKKRKEFIVNPDVENVLIHTEVGLFYTLKRIYDIFKDICENKIMVQPSGTLFDFAENFEEEYIKIRFQFAYLNDDSEKIQRYYSTIIPYEAEFNWPIQQTFINMEDMYLLKLNTQILTKHK